MPPPSVYITVSRSGQTFSPKRWMSSPVLPMTVMSASGHGLLAGRAGSGHRRCRRPEPQCACRQSCRRVRQRVSRSPQAATASGGRRGPRRRGRDAAQRGAAVHRHLGQARVVDVQADGRLERVVDHLVDVAGREHPLRRRPPARGCRARVRSVSSPSRTVNTPEERAVVVPPAALPGHPAEQPHLVAGAGAQPVVPAGGRVVLDEVLPLGAVGGDGAGQSGEARRRWPGARGAGWRRCGTARGRRRSGGRCRCSWSAVVPRLKRPEACAGRSGGALHGRRGLRPGTRGAGGSRSAGGSTAATATATATATRAARRDPAVAGRGERGSR